MGNTKLWHFTCDHGYRGIGKRGMLRPNPHVLMPKVPPMVWLTDDPMPSRDAVGLTSQHISCDRMAFRYRVSYLPGMVGTLVVPWSEVRPNVAPDVIETLESFADSGTWWLAFSPVGAVLA